MALLPKTALITTFPVSGTHQITVSDASSSNSTRTVLTAGTSTYYQTFLGAVTSQDGTLYKPYSIQDRIKAQLSGNIWNLDITREGKVYIQYMGASSASISWNSTVLRNILGFTGSLTFSSSGPTQQTASYQPFGMLFAVARTDDNGSQFQAGYSAFAESPDGTVYGFNDGFSKTRRSFALRYHPDSWSTGVARSNPATPMFPSTVASGNNPPTANTYAPPYSVQNFLFHARGMMTNCFFSTFQDVFSNGSIKIHQCFLSNKSIQATDNIKPSIQNFSQLYDITGIEFWISGGFGV